MESLRLQPVDLSLSGWTPTTAQQNNTEAGKDDTKRILSTPLETLTTENVNGKGAFDVLMKSAKAHLQEEFNAQRITGKEYATVYLGALTAVLQTSIQFLLNEQQVQRINAEIGLIRQQTVTELSNTDDCIPVGLGFNHIPPEVTTIPVIGFPGGSI